MIIGIGTPSSQSKIPPPMASSPIIFAGQKRNGQRLVPCARFGADHSPAYPASSARARSSLAAFDTVEPHIRLWNRMPSNFAHARQDAGDADAGHRITGRNIERLGIGMHRSLGPRQLDFVEARLAIRAGIDPPTGTADEFLLAATVQNLKKLVRFLSHGQPRASPYTA
jgi:hypothetical protein